jgi:hypothetical protein
VKRKTSTEKGLAVLLLALCALWGFNRLFVGAPVAHAGTFTAVSCNQADVNAVINGPTHVAVDGDIINIPAGNCTWSGGVSVPSGIGIQIIGAGTQNSNFICTPSVTTGCGAGTPTVTITGGGFAMAPRFGNSLSRLASINFNPPGLPLTIQGTCTPSGCPTVRVDDLVLPSSWAGVNSDNNTLVFSNMWGVVDHNTVGDNTPRSSYVLLANVGHGAWQGIGDFGDNSWASADTFATTQLINLQNNKAVGNGVLTDTDFPCCSAPGTNFGGGRYACEFNQFLPVDTTSGACPNHGTDTTGRPRGARQIEALYNFGTTSGDNGLWGARSGTARIFGNSFTGSAGSLKFYANLDAQRRWRQDVYGPCDGSPGFDTVDGVNYYPGGSGSATMGAVSFNSAVNGYNVTDSGTPGWTVNQWQDYGAPWSIHETAGQGGAEIVSNLSNILTVVVPGQNSAGTGAGTVPSTGSNYQILRATACLDQPGRGAGALLSGPSNAPALASTGHPGPVNQALDPWYEAADTSVATVAIVSATASIINNRDYYTEAPNQVAQSSASFPFTGALLSPSVTSWTSNGGSGRFTFTLSSVSGFAVNGYITIIGSQAGVSHGTNADGPYQIFSIVGNTVTTMVLPGLFTDSGGAGGVGNTMGTGHGTLANRPTTCTTGAGYWATDQGTWNMSGGTSQGIFSTCVSTNTWANSYTPACYPSPLIAGSPCAGGSTAPIANLSPGSLSFGNVLVGSTSAAQNLTLSNTGTATLTISSIAPGGASPADFSQTNNCGSAVTAGGSCTIAVKFTPLSAATFSANITVTDNAAGSPHTASLSGTGITATAGISFSPTSLTFSSQTVGTSSSPQAVTVTNTGSANLVITAIAPTGGSSTSFSQTNNCGTVAASGTCTINVMFTPQAAGALASQICVTDNAPASPQCFNVSGTGTATGNIGFNPASLTFPNTAVGQTSAIQTITVRNSGGSPITISSIAASGDFSETNNCGATLAAGGSCTVSVKFTPTTNGSRTGNITFTDSAPGSPQTVSLQGVGFTPAPQVTLSVATVTFGNQTTGTASNPQVVIVTNTGTASLSISATSITGTNAGDFGQSSTCGGTLAVNASCTYSFVFTPTAAGSRSATFNLTTNAPSSVDHVSLSGTGVMSPNGAPAPQVFGD